MTSKKNKARAARESTRKFKKKANPLNAEKVVYIDYKDVTLLQRFMSDRSKIRGRRMSGTDVQQQRDIANAIKNAREMALLPYTKRVTSTRAPRAERREDDSTLEMPDQPIEARSVDVSDAVEASVESATPEVVDDGAEVLS
jgi:small subunit ribosomal protein S18